MEIKSREYIQNNNFIKGHTKNKCFAVPTYQTVEKYYILFCDRSHFFFQPEAMAFLHVFFKSYHTWW